MKKKEVLSALVEGKKAAVLDTLLAAKEDLYLKEIAQRSKVSIATTFRILQALVKAGLIARKAWKTSKLYCCQDTEEVQFLRELFHTEYDGVQDFVSLVQDLPGVQSIIMQGEGKKGKANLILLGESMDTAKIEEACQKVREKGFELSYLTLARKQYEQMLRMGLYGGEKRVLK